MAPTMTNQKEMQDNFCRVFGVSTYEELEGMSELERRELIARAKKRHAHRKPTKHHPKNYGDACLRVGLMVKYKEK